MNCKTRPLVIFDIDGTTTLLGDRRKLLDTNDPDRWDRFYDRVNEDLPNTPVITIMNALVTSGIEVWFFSGRTDRVREQTITQLSEMTCFTKEELSGPMLTMRPHGNGKPDHELKEGWLRHMLLEDIARLVCIYDDRQSVVDMWRSNGIPCMQVDVGNF